MEDAVFVYEGEKGVVRIHPGRLTESERKEVLIQASKEFYKAIIKQGIEIGGAKNGNR